MDITHPNKPTDWHLPDLCKFGSGLFVMMQIAILLGYRELRLIGCDLGYRTGAQTHFDRNYSVLDAEIDSNRNATLNYAHEIAKIECEKLGIKVVNYTVGGELEVYPRIPFVVP